MKIKLEEYAIVNGGVLDLEGTLEKFHTDLVEYWETELKASKDITEHMLDIFSAPGFERANCPYVVSESLRRSNATPKNWSEMEVRAKKILKGLSEAGFLTITKGPEGGVTRGEKHPAYVAKPVA